MLKSFLCISILMSSLLWAAPAPLEEITLEEMIQKALDHHLDYAMAEVNLENALLDYEKTKASNLMTGSTYIEYQAELIKLQAEDTFRQTENMVIIEAVQQYFQLLQAKMDIHIREKQVTLEEKLLEETRNQVEAGHKGTLELLQQQNSYDSALFNLEQARNEYEELLAETAVRLHMPEEYIVPLPVRAPDKFWEMSSQEVREKAFQENKSILLREKQLKLAQLDLERALVSATPDLDKKKLKNNVIIAELQLQKVQEDLRSTATQHHSTLNHSKRNLQLVQQNLEQARENYEIISSQKKSGLRTEGDLLAAEIALLQAQYSLTGTINNYYLNLLRLQQLLGYEIGVFLDEIRF